MLGNSLSWKYKEVAQNAQMDLSSKRLMHSIMMQVNQGLAHYFPSFCVRDCLKGIRLSVGKAAQEDSIVMQIMKMPESFQLSKATKDGFAPCQYTHATFISLSTM